MARPFAGPICALALTAASMVAPLVAHASEPAVVPDRYGPAAAAPAPAPAAYGYAPVGTGRETARAAPLRFLDWPGKAATPQATATQPAPAPAPVAYAPAPRPAPYAARPATAYAAPYAAPVVSPAFSAAPAASGPTPLPPPYFAAPTPGMPPPASTALAGPLAAAQPATSAGPTQHARLYSVHRAYGLQPDPAPIPPQFFAQTADLSEPATSDPIPSRAANAASRNAVNAARLAAAETN